MNQTPNYQLSQWEASDRIQRTDFNADNAKIDAALGTLAAQLTAEVSKERFYIGSYIGDGTSTSGKTPRTIPLPWTPKIVFVSGYYAVFSNGNSYECAIAFGEYCHKIGGGSSVPWGDIKIVPNGFQITGQAHNEPDTEEHYIAIR